MTTEQIPAIISLIDGDGPGPRDVLVVEQATLPMLLLRDVSVVLRDVREPISVLQRFLLQAALDAGVLNLHEAQQASSVPLFALRRLAWEFARAGLFTTVEQSDCFAPNNELCRRSLAMDRVELEKPGRLHFVFLPESDELVALVVDDHTRKFVTELQNCEPDAGYPTPTLEGVACGEFLQQRMGRGEISGLPADFLRFDTASLTPAGPSSETASPLPSAIPAFRVGFTALSDKEALRCRLRLLAIRKSPEVDLSAARVLLSRVMEHVGATRSPAESIPSLRAQGFPAGVRSELVFESPVRAKVPLEAWAAQQVASRGWLTRSTVLRVQYPSLAITLRASLAFTAADTEADRLFAIDEAAQELLRLPSTPTSKALATAVDRVGRGAETSHVVDRLWQGGEYACIHAIRVQEDLYHA